jgi:hypothetical protein
MMRPNDGMHMAFADSLSTQVGLLCNTLTIESPRILHATVDTNGLEVGNASGN